MERQSLQKFQQGWDEYKKSQEQTLKLVVENSNFKAHALVTGKLAERIEAINQAAATGLRQLEKQPADVPAANDAQSSQAAEKDRRALSRLQVLALELHRQLSQRVFDTTDEDMDRVDEQIAGWQKEMDERLQELNASANSGGFPWLETLSSAFRELRPQVAQLQKLLRINSNTRSVQADSRIEQVHRRLYGGVGGAGGEPEHRPAEPT